MKKILIAVLSLSIVAALWGCSGRSKDDGAEETRYTVPQRAPDTQPQDPVPEETEPAQTVPEQTEPEEEVTVTESVVYQQDGLRVTVKALTEGALGPRLELEVCNDTGNDLLLSAEQVQVNGATVPAYAYIEAAAGKTVEDAVELSRKDLELAGISTLTDIQVQDMQIVDKATYETVGNCSFTVQTSVSDYVQVFDRSGTVLWQGEDVKVVYRQEDRRLLICNDSDRAIIVQTLEGADLWLYDRVYAGTVRFRQLALSEEGAQVTLELQIVDAQQLDVLAQTPELALPVTQADA